MEALEQLRLFLRGAARGTVETALGYPAQVSPRELRERYRRNGVARALVDARPDETWAGEHSLTRGDAEASDLDEIFRRHRLEWACFRADLAAEITGLGAILLPGESLALPPTAMELERWGLSVYGLDQIVPEIEYGEITSWTLRESRQEDQRGGAETVRIAPERVVPIADTRYSDSGVYGIPRLLTAWNLLLDLEKVVGGGADAYWRNSYSLKQMDIVTPGEAAPPMPAEVEAVKDALRDIDAGTNRTLVTSGGTFTLHAPTVAAFSGESAHILSLLAAAFRVPLTVLTGEALVAHSASTSLTSWHNRIAERRRAYVAPDIVAPVVAWAESVLAGRRGVVTAEERAAIGVDWSAPSLGDDMDRTSAIVETVREGILDAQRGLELLPENWFGAQEQRLLGEQAMPDETGAPPEGVPFDAPVNDDDGYGLPQ